MRRKIRNRRRLTQIQSIFYILYNEWQVAKEKGEQPRYVPVFELMGEVYCREVGKWGYVSYECSARASEMIKANPELIQRRKIEGKSGAKYYGYRINPFVKKEMIQDPQLVEFHRAVMRRREIIKQRDEQDTQQTAE
jgi:hypothetical protein